MTQKINTIFSNFSAFWQQRLTEECDRLREQTTQLQRKYDEQSRSFSNQIETLTTQNREYLQVLTEMIL